MVVAVFLYFVFASVALAVLLLPQARAQAMGLTQRLRGRGARMGGRVALGVQRRAGQVRRAAAIGVGGGATWLGARRRQIALVAFLLAFATLVPLALRGRIALDAYDQRASREVNQQVAALLQGEQLVPPPPLPPELFMTREVEQARPLIRGASHQWELLDAEFRQRLLIVFKLMHERHGIDLVLIEGYRSPERQAALAALGNHVTRAGAFESYHQYGLAADVAFLREGRIVISERDPWAASAYALYGDVARSVGLTWGGDWPSLKDYGHVELRRAGVLGRAQ